MTTMCGNGPRDSAVVTGECKPAGTATSGDTTALATMVRIRHFELTINELFGKGKVRGTAHLCVGQEAVAAGVCAALRRGDTIAATHRGHGVAIATGLSLYRLFAEILGRRDGYCAGRGGSQHIACLERGFLGTNGISGGGLPIATGAALASKSLGRQQVSVAFFGDGVANQGTFHESLNMAAIWRLPIVFVCENNLYAMSAPVRAFVAGGDIARRAEAYGIPHETIDGNDVRLVRETTANLVARARSGEGPALLECMTYRQLGHSKSDACVYRTREEEEAWRKRDPIALERQRLTTGQEFGEAELTALEGGIIEEVQGAAERAMACPVSDATTLFDHVTPAKDPQTPGGAPW